MLTTGSCFPVAFAQNKRAGAKPALSNITGGASRVAETARLSAFSVVDGCDDACADGATAFTDGEA
ncbi:hypothetical protein, partial [Methylobacterium sp. Leaf86]|uniref:hypothetical protein n=1 Tax=Methylobacterium sp. Leaf86 TaxID=1736242 RepID=UPI00244E9045